MSTDFGPPTSLGVRMIAELVNAHAAASRAELATGPILPLDVPGSGEDALRVMLLDGGSPPEIQSCRRESDRSTLRPFDWSVLKSGTSRYWTLASALLAEQRARLAADGVIPRQRFGEEGSLWTAVDLALGDSSTFTWFDKGVYVPARDVRSVAAGGSMARLGRGLTLRLEAVSEDRSGGGMDTNFWSLGDGDLDVGFIHSALGIRWGGAARLGDALIVPLDHPIAGDIAGAKRLVVDLQAITRAFRAANGLPAEGEDP